ncbi:zinc finger protein 383-like [Discoglossus pictus]
MMNMERMPMTEKTWTENPKMIFSHNGQGQFEFDEVAVHFSKEEWECLTEEDKELYKNVMIENYLNLMCVVSVCVKPTIVSMIERGEEPYVRGHQPSEENTLNINTDCRRYTGNLWCDYRLHMHLVTSQVQALPVIEVQPGFFIFSTGDDIFI